jgi:hypothetical protein
MPHFKCDACKTRVHSQEHSPQVVYLCLGCGGLLEPVTELAEVVGYRKAAQSVSSSAELTSVAQAAALPAPEITS